VWRPLREWGKVEADQAGPRIAGRRGGGNFGGTEITLSYPKKEIKRWTLDPAVSMERWGGLSSSETRREIKVKRYQKGKFEGTEKVTTQGGDQTEKEWKSPPRGATGPPTTRNHLFCTVNGEQPQSWQDEDNEKGIAAVGGDPIKKTKKGNRFRTRRGN